MATITPHRDAVEACLAQMREGIREAKQKDPARALAFDLTLGIAEGAMRPMGDARDLHVPTQRIAEELVMAFGNVLSSLSVTLANGEPLNAKAILGYLAHNSMAAALRFMESPPDNNSVEVFYKDQPAGRA